MGIETLKEIVRSTEYLVIFIAIVVSALYLLSLSSKIRGFIYKQKYSAREKMGMILFFGLLGILASEFGFRLAGSLVNVRDFIAIFAAILGGPVVGIGAALISGLYRMTGVLWTGFSGTLGYWTAIGCGVATIGAGCLGAYLSKYKNMNIRNITTKQIWMITVITALWQVIHLEVIVPLIAPLYNDRTFLGAVILLGQTLLLPMALVNALGILLFLFITRDTVIKREAEIAEKEMIDAELKEREQPNQV
jgi:LytS/YehU family sensor histidine kinase